MVVLGMPGREEKGFGILMPPEFEYLGGLFMPDRIRARVTGLIAAAVPRWQASGYRVFFEPGTEGKDAARTALSFRERGLSRAVTVGGPFDQTGLSMLTEALEAVGVACGRPIRGSEDPGEVIQGLSKRVESLARMDHPYSASISLDQAAPPPFLILGEGEAIPTHGVAFRMGGRELVRVTDGKAGFIPSWIRAVQYVHPEDRQLGFQASDRIYAFLLPSPHANRFPAQDRCLALCKEIIREAGAHRFRLALEAGASQGPEKCGGAPWAIRYGLPSSWHRDFLRALVSEMLPEKASLLHTVIGFYEVGSDPLEEMYAGNGIADRNQELIENIVS
jgi:hypothetical protein